jgi:hypothetical protein
LRQVFLEQGRVRQRGGIFGVADGAMDHAAAVAI